MKFNDEMLDGLLETFEDVYYKDTPKRNIVLENDKWYKGKISEVTLTKSLKNFPNIIITYNLQIDKEKAADLQVKYLLSEGERRQSISKLKIIMQGLGITKDRLDKITQSNETVVNEIVKYIDENIGTNIIFKQNKTRSSLKYEVRVDKDKDERNGKN